MKQWKIFYGDGTTWDNDNGPAEKAPALNVACIVYYDNGARRLLHRWDWYYFKDGGSSPVWGSDIHGLLDQLMSDTGRNVYAVKQGRTYEDKTFQDILLKAINDPDFPPQLERGKLDRNEGIK